MKHKAGEIQLSVVIPCYNEEESLPELVKTLVPQLEAATDGAWEIILVDDGSADRTAEMIEAENRRDPRIRGVMLTRNFGHQPAIFAGLTYAAGRFIGIMDAGLRDPPSVLIECYRKALAENYDLVYAVRQRREAGWFLKLGYWSFYRLMRLLAEYSWPLDAGDFSVFNRRVLSLLMGLPARERWRRSWRSTGGSNARGAVGIRSGPSGCCN